MTKKELGWILSHAKGPDLTTPFDKEAFYNGPKGVDDILKEASRRHGQEVYLQLDGVRATKFSIHVLAFAIWHDMMLSETHRTFKKGGGTSVKAEGQLVSETHRTGDAHAVTICRGVREEMSTVLKPLGIAVEPTHFDFRPMASVSAKLEPPRESTVYVGWVSRRLVYCAVWDLARYSNEQPWPDGLCFTDNDGTTIHAQWKPLSGAFLNAMAEAKAQVVGRPNIKKLIGKKRTNRRKSRVGELFS